MYESQCEDLDWLNSYVDQSVTFSSWRKVESKLSQILKQNLEKKLMDPVNRQILFEILGNDFVQKYFGSYTNSPAVLDNIRAEEKKKKVAEMKAFIYSVIDNILQKNGPKSDGKIQNDLDAFSQDVKNEVDDQIKEVSETKSKKNQKSDLPEKYLLELLASDPSLIDELIPQLAKQHPVLSDKLRLCFWPACISPKEKAKAKKNSGKIKDKYTQLYNKLQNSHDMKEELHSIYPAVSKIYTETNCIQSLATEKNINSSAVLLHLCNANGRKFEAPFVYYAVVFQQAYLKENPSDYAQTAFVLDQVLRLGAPNANRTTRIVNRTIETLSEVDKQFLNQLETVISGKNIIASKEKIGDSVSGSPLKSNSTEDLAFHLRKWVACSFVSVLKPNVLFFIWDQLFLNRWENKIFQDICIALLGLLKPWFLAAKNRNGYEKVLMEEPGLLYTLDVRNALFHLQNKGEFTKIPALNRNIKQGVSIPSPVVPPPPVPQVPVELPKPKPMTPPPPPKPVKIVPKFIPWVPYVKNRLPNQGKNTVDLPFDLYVDSVRFVPDNSTVVKITGKVLNMYLGKKDKFIKFQVFPELDSFWRYPRFKFKQNINLDAIPMNPDTVVMIRVYTIEHHSKIICVLGSCLFCPFSNKHGKQATLREGGHQIRVRHGIPDPDFNVEHMLASHMDDNPLIPGMTVLLRVLPHGKEFIPPPEYETNYYRSEFAKPNPSEIKLYTHYEKSKDLSLTVRDSALLLTGQATANDLTLKSVLQQQMEKEGFDVQDFPYQRYVHYNKEHGMMVLVDKASGLPLFLEGRYLQCLAQVFPGEDSKIGDGKSQVASFVTNELDIESPQRAPDWSDQPKRINPDYDDRAFVLVTLYGLRPRFDVANQRLHDREGREPKFNLQQAIAWSSAPCFDKGSVFAGIHHIPLLKGRPPDDIIQKLSYLPLDYICKKFKSQVKVFDSASIEVSIWDGHFSNSECPPLPVHTQSLNISNNPSKYIKASQHTSGATALDLLKKSTADPADFFKSKAKILQLLSSAFKSNLDHSLVKEGYKATI